MLDRRLNQDDGRGLFSVCVLKLKDVWFIQHCIFRSDN